MRNGRKTSAHPRQTWWKLKCNDKTYKRSRWYSTSWWNGLFVRPSADAGVYAPHSPGSSGTTFQIPSNSNISTVTYPNLANPMTTQPRAKLPKLILLKFRGHVTQWQGFWDSYNSSIHTNPQLSQIDKFNHLHSLLEGQAACSRQGLTRSEANYNSAINLLHTVLCKSNESEMGEFRSLSLESSSKNSSVFSNVLSIISLKQRTKICGIFKTRTTILYQRVHSPCSMRNIAVQCADQYRAINVPFSCEQLRSRWRFTPL